MHPELQHVLNCPDCFRAVQAEAARRLVRHVRKAARNMTQKERTERARNAVKARWAKVRSRKRAKVTR